MFAIENREVPPYRVGFAGAGNMAAAMARGWARVGEGEPPVVESMAFADAGSGRAQELAAEIGGEAVDGLSELQDRSDVLVLAFKPAALPAVAAELRPDGRPLISVLAGVSVDSLEAAFPGAPVGRVMPNVAVEVRRGVLCYVAPRSAGLKRALLQLLAHLGVPYELDEDRLNAATAVMSCSPAYIALVAEALAKAGGHAALDSSLAHQLVVDTLVGTAELLRSRAPEDIRRAVAPPGGATEAGLEVLARRGLGKAVGEAVEASLERMRS